MPFLHVRFCSVSVRKTELLLTFSVLFGQNGKTLLRSVTSSYESLAMLDGKIRVTPFFKVQSGKITVCPRRRRNWRALPVCTQVHVLNLKNAESAT